MSTLGKRLRKARENEGISRETAAMSLGIREEILEAWEKGEEIPGVTMLPEISECYHVTNDWLLTGSHPSERVLHVTGNVSNRLFDEKRMSTYISGYANARGFYETKKALAYATEMHRGQFRKEREGERVPYIYHPLLMTCHALSLGFYEDDLLATVLLHDVCEDCGVSPDDLPFNEVIRDAVACMTKPQDFVKTREMQAAYFEKIGANRIATVVKLLDRCQNISGMAGCFGDDKMAGYIMETETYLYPIYRKAKGLYPEYSDQLFLIKYHMSSVIETLRHYMKAKL